MRVLVVQHTRNEGLGLLYQIVDQNRWQVDLKLMEEPAVRLPRNMHDYEAMLILGGPMGAYEESRYPYLCQLQDLIREASISQLPTLGICLGAQLMARAMGAPVGPHTVKEIGWYPMTLTASGMQAPVFAGLPHGFAMFEWHGDSFELPQGALLLATGETCTNQAFSYGPNMWAFQFHPEVTPSIIHNWVAGGSAELALAGIRGRDVMQATETHWAELASVRRILLRNLALLIQG